MGGRWELLLLIGLIAMAVAEEEPQSDGPLFIVEKRGNSSLECIRSAPCSPCSFAEKQSDDIYHCSATGYYISYHCVEVNDNSSVAAKPAAIESGKQSSTPSDGSTNKLNQKVIVLNKSCVPAPVQDRLSVLGLEGIMLGLLAIFSPVLYYRKKRSSPGASGMTRVPTSRVV